MLVNTQTYVYLYVGIDLRARAQQELKALLLRSRAELCAEAEAVLVGETVLALDVWDASGVWLQCFVAVDVREHADLRLGAAPQHVAELQSILRPPVHCEVGAAESLQL